MQSTTVDLRQDTILEDNKKKYTNNFTFSKL
nr:MAG TPA: hypothetical protein [Caudoviricetes sp.]